MKLDTSILTALEANWQVMLAAMSRSESKEQRRQIREALGHLIHDVKAYAAKIEDLADRMQTNLLEADR